MTQEELVKKHVGIPYVHLGRDPKKGLDCLGLVLSVYKDLGYDFSGYDYENYSEDWASTEEQDHFIDKLPDFFEKVSTPEIYDLVLFKNYRGLSNHSGIVLKNGRFLHTCKAGTVTGRLKDPRWFNSLTGFYRVKKS